MNSPNSQEAHRKYHRGKRENAFIHMIRVIQTIQISTISLSTVINRVQRESLKTTGFNLKSPYISHCKNYVNYPMLGSTNLFSYWHPVHLALLCTRRFCQSKGLYDSFCFVFSNNDFFMITSYNQSFYSV